MYIFHPCDLYVSSGDTRNLLGSEGVTCVSEGEKLQKIALFFPSFFLLLSDGGGGSGDRASDEGVSPLVLPLYM